MASEDSRFLSDNRINLNGKQVADDQMETGKFLNSRVLSRVFSEDYESVRTILDPRGEAIHRWNKIFLAACLVSLFVDPLFFYLPIVGDEVCIDIGITLEVFLTVIRSMADLFYIVQILVRFRTAYVAPSSRVFGRGELVIDSSKIETRYLQSTTVRLEEWRVKRTDTEQWMHHRQLPPELRESVRKYDQYKWLATRGVDEQTLLKGLPLDLRRDIKRHLCLELVRRVPLFEQMDERMLDAICERLKPSLCTENTYLVREGDPVNEMVFIIRGHLDSFTTNGGRTGFFNSCRIGPGDFCGEELLTWALELEDPRPRVNNIPCSTRTVKSISEVEAFALIAEDLKFVASQFRRLHSKQVRHKLRFHSHQWRTWGACFVQAAWRRTTV